MDQQNFPEQLQLTEILNQLSPSAPAFRPRAMTTPDDQLSRSLPTNVPGPASPSKRPKGSRTPKHLKDNRIAPRFYPAICKEKLSDDGLVSTYAHMSGEVYARQNGEIKILCLKFPIAFEWTYDFLH